MHFHCDRCGDTQVALLNGYRFGDVQLEGIWFIVTVSKDGKVADFQPTEESKPFFANLSAEKMVEILDLGKQTAQEMIESDDLFTCGFCKDDAVVDE
jgi:uncharacterized protein YuzB (UPF0349 family)